MQREKKKRDYATEGIPAFWWPTIVTSYALIERILGGFGVAKFYELTTNPNGSWIVTFLGVVSGTFVTNKWVRGINESKANTRSESSTTFTKETSSQQGSQSPPQP